MAGERVGIVACTSLARTRRAFFHNFMEVWPEEHCVFSGRRFNPWHHGVDTLNPFVSNLLSRARLKSIIRPKLEEAIELWQDLIQDLDVEIEDDSKQDAAMKSGDQALGD